MIAMSPMSRMSRCHLSLAALAAVVGCAADIRPEGFGADSGTGPGVGPDAGPTETVTVVENADGSSTVRVNATDLEAWVYLDLSELAQMEPADPATSADWDLALQRFHYALDGGVSGAGQGALIVVDGAELADVSAAPAEEWVTDLPDDAVDEDVLPEYAFETAEEGWYDYDPASHRLSPKQRVYVVRGGAGALFALRIDTYYNGPGTPGWPKFTVKPLAASAR
jgi:HmuY protein